MITCYLIRHGQDLPGVRGGWSENGLTDKGREQVQKLVERFTQPDAPKISRIYASDLPRTMETAQILADALGLEVIPKKDFREVNNGLLAGMDNDLALETYPGLFWNRMRWNQRYPEGESPREFHDRIRRAWRKFSAGIVQSGENVILVTHGGVISLLQDLVDGVRYSNREKHHWISFTAVVPLTYREGRWHTARQKKTGGNP